MHRPLALTSRCRENARPGIAFSHALLATLLFAGALLVGGCGHSGTAPAGAQRAGTPDTKAATAEFWRWFSETAAVVPGGGVDAKQIGERLQRIHRGLGCDVEGKGDTRTLVITANGDIMLFGLVKEVARQAPSLTGWRVTALRPRRTLQAVKTATATVRPDDVAFTASPDQGRLSVNLFVRGLSSDNEDDVGAGALTLLQQAVGEEDAFGVVTLGPIAAMPATPPTGLRPLADLPAAVDAVKKKPAP